MNTFRKYSFNQVNIPPIMGVYTRYSFNQIDIPPTYSPTETNPAVYDEEGNLISPETPVELTPGIYRTPQQEYEYQLSQIEPECSISHILNLGSIENTPAIYEDTPTIVPAVFDDEGHMVYPEQTYYALVTPATYTGYTVGIIWESAPSTYLSQFMDTPSEIEGIVVPGIYRTPQQEYEYQLSQIEPECSIYSTKPLGLIVNTPGEYDQDGNVITSPTYHPGYAVDILWNGQPSTYLSQFEVWPSGLGVHTWWGFESQYEEARNIYKQNNP